MFLPSFVLSQHQKDFLIHAQYAQKVCAPFKRQRKIVNMEVGVEGVILNKLHRKKVVGRWSVSGWPTNYRPPTVYLLTTYRPPTHRPLTDHILTTYRPLTDHIPLFYGAVYSILPVLNIVDTTLVINRLCL